MINLFPNLIKDWGIKIFKIKSEIKRDKKTSNTYFREIMF